MCVCYHVFLENISLHFSTRMSRGKYYNGPKEIQLPSKIALFRRNGSPKNFYSLSPHVPFLFSHAHSNHTQYYCISFADRHDGLQNSTMGFFT